MSLEQKLVEAVEYVDREEVIRLLELGEPLENPAQVVSLDLRGRNLLYPISL